MRIPSEVSAGEPWYIEIHEKVENCEKDVKAVPSKWKFPSG